MKGSLTVEAACIMPFCFLVIAIVCVLGIYEYNQVVLQMTGYECILETVAEQPENLEADLKNRAEVLAQHRSLAMKDLCVTVKTTGTKVFLSLKGVQGILSIPLEVKAVYERTFPEVTLRFLKKGSLGAE